MKYITFLFLLLTQLSFGQPKSLIKIIDQIDYQTDTLQAVYDWVTDNIKYDVAKLKKIKSGDGKHKKGKFKNRAEYRANQLEVVIKKKKGVCEDYSLLFNSIVSELGYASFIITGVTKLRDGKVMKDSAHAWNTVKVNGVWKLYDPTWGAGYVKGAKKFIKKYNPKWYDTDPEVMKERHFPFDHIWQLSENPMTYQEFQKDTQSDESKTPYDFNEMIASHLKKEEKEKLIDELNRSELNGGNIKAIKKRRKTLQKKIDNFNIYNNADLFNNTINNCRESSKLFGEYINEGKNKRFKGKKWTLEYSQSTLLSLKDTVTESIATFETIDTKGLKSKRNFKKMINQSKNILAKVDKELEFLNSKM
ncbi:MAG: hypothetical protein ACI86M_000378 [Saprospiraceae bacterium]|jgi:hypothetical protein